MFIQSQMGSLYESCLCEQCGNNVFYALAFMWNFLKKLGVDPV